MSNAIHPKNLQKIGTEMAIAWSDDTETFLPLEKLRKACPCAACGGEPDVMGKVIRPQVSYEHPGSFELTAWEIVGGYGWQPRWGDGHRTGIYTFPYLRKLGEAPSPQEGSV